MNSFLAKIGVKSKYKWLFILHCIVLYSVQFVHSEFKDKKTDFGMFLFRSVRSKCLACQGTARSTSPPQKIINKNVKQIYYFDYQAEPYKPLEGASLILHVINLQCFSNISRI